MSDDDGAKLLIGLGIAGLGLLIWQESQRRREFREHLAHALAERGLDLVSSDLGKRPDGASLWHLTVQHPFLGVYSLKADLPSNAEPYSEGAQRELVTRVLHFFGSRGA